MIFRILLSQLCPLLATVQCTSLPISDSTDYDGVFSSMGAGAGPETGIICSRIDLAVP